MGFIEYIEFEKNITRTVVMTLHILLTVACFVGLVYFVVTGIRDDEVINILIGVFGMPVVYLIGRLLLERMVISFAIHEEACVIAENSSRRK